MIPSGSGPATVPGGPRRGLELAIAAFMVLIIAGAAVFALTRSASGSQSGLGAGPATPSTGPTTVPAGATATSTPQGLEPLGTPGTVEATPTSTAATQPATATPTAPPSATPIPTPSSAPAPPTSTPPPPPTAAPGLTADQARQVVGSYFDDINRKDYAAAYALLGPTMQAQQSYANFAAGFGQTAHVTLTVNGVSSTGGSAYSVSVSIAGGQTDGSVKYFHGTYTVDLLGGTPRIVSAQIVAG